MKKLGLLVFLNLIMLSSNFGTEVNTNKEKITSIVSSREKLSREEMKLLIARLNDIKKMDFHAMNSLEKSNIKKEVGSIREKVNKDSGFFVYLSTTAILIIILLLIVL
jgi:hypothetical protein